MLILGAAIALVVLSFSLGFMPGGRFGWRMATLNAVKEYDSALQSSKDRIDAILEESQQRTYEATKLCEDYAEKIRELSNGRH